MPVDNALRPPPSQARGRPLQVRQPRLICRSAPHPDLVGWCPQSLVWARDDSSLFDFADVTGELMWVFPVFAEADRLIDYVSWRRENPTRWWLKTGAAIVTSPWLFKDALDWGDPVHLVATPEQWAADALHRACILQPEVLDLAYFLQRFPNIVCSEDLEA